MYECDDSSLISLVRQNPNIYDKTNKLFKNKILRKSTWINIGQQMNKSAKDCEQRWTILRNRYAKEKRQEKIEKLSGVIDVVRTPWHLLTELEFLARHVIGRRSASAYYSSSDVSISFNKDEPFVNTPEASMDTEMSTKSFSINEERTTASIKEEYDDFEEHNQEPSNLRQLHAKLIESENALQSTLTEIRKYFQETTNYSNEDDVFAKTIVCMLKHVHDSKKKKSVKLEIMKILTEADDSN